MRKCSVCGHPNRAAIEAAISQGLSYRDAAAEWSVSSTAVFRHTKSHFVAAESALNPLAMAVGSDVGLSPSSKAEIVAATGNVVSFPRATPQAFQVPPDRSVELVQRGRRKRQATISTFLSLRNKGFSTPEIAEELAISEENAVQLEARADEALAFIPCSRSAEWIAGHVLQSYIDEIVEREDMYEEARHCGMRKQALDIRDSILRVRRELLERMKEFGMLDGLRSGPDHQTMDILQAVEQSIKGEFREKDEAGMVERLL